MLSFPTTRRGKGKRRRVSGSLEGEEEKNEGGGGPEHFPLYRRMRKKGKGSRSFLKKKRERTHCLGKKNLLWKQGEEKGKGAAFSAKERSERRKKKVPYGSSAEGRGKEEKGRKE